MPRWSRAKRISFRHTSRKKAKVNPAADGQHIVAQEEVGSNGSRSEDAAKLSTAAQMQGCCCREREKGFIIVIFAVGRARCEWKLGSRLHRNCSRPIRI